MASIVKAKFNENKFNENKFKKKRGLRPPHPPFWPALSNSSRNAPEHTTFIALLTEAHLGGLGLP